MRRNIYYLMAGLMILKLGVHFLTASNYELHRDALLYISLGENPAWGYASVPPSIGFFANISRFLLGDTFFAIRFFPALTGALSIFIIGLTIRDLGGKLYAVFLGGFSFLLSIAYLRSNALFQPVSFNQFYWLLSFYLAITMIRKNKPWYWLWIGLVWGLALLNKYSIAFLIIGILFSLLLTEHRRMLFRKEFFLGMGISILIFFPNLIWQYQHNWPVIHHMRELQETQLVNTTLAGFILAQVLMNLHAVFVWMAGLIAVFAIPSLRKYRFISLTWGICIFLLILLRGKGYYTLGLYSILFAFGALALEKWTEKRYNYIRYVMAGLIAVIAIPLTPLSLPLLKHDKMAAYSQKISRVIGPGFLTWEDGEVHSIPQDFADMTGWKELASLTQSAWESLPAPEKKETKIFAGNYGMAGAILYYSGEEVPPPLSFSDSFILWAPDSIWLEVLIYVDHDTEDIAPWFGNIKKFGSVEDEYFRENGLSVFICRDPVPEFFNLYTRIAADYKNNFKR